ncbi:MAG: nucleoside-diphosphate sugar epimerase/dehydratase, partial [Acidimicrobiales bacterium]
MDDVAVLEEAVLAGPFDIASFEDRLLDDDERRARLLEPQSLGAARVGLSEIVTDAFALVLAIVVAALVLTAAHRAGGDGGGVLGALDRLVVCIPLLLVVLARSRHRLRRQLGTTVAQQLREAALPVAAATLVCIAGWRVVAGLGGAPNPPEDGLLLGCAVGIVTVALARVWRHARTLRHGERARRIVLVGSGAVADRVASQLEVTGRVRVIGFVDDDPKDPTGCLGPLERLASICERESVDHVVVAFSRSSAEEMVEALRPVQGKLPISVVPRLFDVLPATADAHHLVSGYP